MGTLTTDDVIAALRLLEMDITLPQRDGVRRVLEKWRLAGRANSVSIDDAELALLRSLATRHSLRVANGK